MTRDDPPSRSERPGGSAVERIRARLNSGRTPSPPSALLAALVILSVIFGASAFIAAQYFGIDVPGSVTYIAVDHGCPDDDVERYGIGGHCFSDYYRVADFTERADPWAGAASIYPAAGMLPHLVFTEIGRLFGDLRIGLVLYLLTMMAGMIAPAVWATRGRPALTRVLIIALVGLLAIPALAAFDRGNSIGFVVPALFVFARAMLRDRFFTAAVAVAVASLVKPQYAVLVVVLLAARRWRAASVALASTVVGNLLAYLAWPSALPGSVAESIGKALGYSSETSMGQEYPTLTSIPSSLHQIERTARVLLGLPTPTWVDANASVAGLAVLALVLIVVVIVGKRLAPVHSMIAVFAAASLFVPTTYSYYLVFALVVGALVLRDVTADPNRVDLDASSIPLGSGGDRVLGAAIIVATAGSLTRVLLPTVLQYSYQRNSSDFVSDAPYDATATLLATNGALVPFLWLLVIGMTIVLGVMSMRRPAADTPSQRARRES